jgi:hypothetical protein
LDHRLESFDSKVDLTTTSTEARSFDFDPTDFGNQFVVEAQDRHQFSAAEQGCELLVVVHRKTLLNYSGFDCRIVVRDEDDDPFVFSLHPDLRFVLGMRLIAVLGRWLQGRSSDSRAMAAPRFSEPSLVC